MAVPVHKSNRALAWRLAVAAGGLLHDLGKPFTDFEVWNEDGKIHWPPCHEPIHIWAKENNVKDTILYGNRAVTVSTPPARAICC